MQTKRKSHNLDERLLRRAQRSLGTPTETETIHEALRAVLLGKRLMADLEAVSGRVTFRPQFEKRMRREGHRGAIIRRCARRACRMTSLSPPVLGAWAH